MTFKSDINKPIGFFEDFISDKSISSYYSQFLDDFVNPEIDKIEGNFVIKPIFNDNWEEIEAKYDLQKEFQLRLYNKINEELIISKGFIDQIALDTIDIANQYFKKFEQILHLSLENKINHIFNNQASILKKYSFIKKGLIELANNSNSQYREYLIEPLFVDETIIEKELYNLNSMSFDTLFKHLFLFLVEEKHLTKVDFERLFNYCKAFVNRKEIENINKIPVFTLSGNVLDSLFGIIYKKYKHIKIKDMTCFLGLIMENYASESTINTFSKKYNSSIDIAKHPYLSAFVKGYFKSR
jgi:hypothetical protein